MGSAPEKSVMNNQQIGPGIDGQPDGGQAGVDRGGDFRYRAGIFNLQSIGGAIVVFDFGGAEQVVAVLDDFEQRNAGHSRKNANQLRRGGLNSNGESRKSK